jgi:hypothetical protein
MREGKRRLVATAKKRTLPKKPAKGDEVEEPKIAKQNYGMGMWHGVLVRRRSRLRKAKKR